MSVANAAGRELPVASETPPSAVRVLLDSWEGRIGVAVGMLILLIILGGPVLAPYNSDAIGLAPSLSGPSAAHLLGTDDLGRDVLSRFLTGGRLLLLIPIGAVAISLVLGGVPGILGAYVGGTTDLFITRIFDFLLTLPPLLIVLDMISGIGTSTSVLVLTVGLVYAPRVGRIARGATQAVITGDYILAAQARGERTMPILFREIGPNIVGPMVADVALRLTYAVIFVATLNFLGLGAQPPSSDWGLSLATAREYLQVQPWATIAPSAGIAGLSVSYNLIADALARRFVRGSTRWIL